MAQFEYPFPTIKLEEITHKQLQSFISHWFTTLEKGRKTKKKTWLLLWKNYHSAFSFYLGYRTLLKFSCIIPKSKGMSLHGIRHFHGLSPRHEHAKKLYDTGFRERAVIPLPLKSFILIMDHRRSKFHQHNWKKKKILTPSLQHPVPIGLSSKWHRSHMPPIPPFYRRKQ